MISSPMQVETLPATSVVLATNCSSGSGECLGATIRRTRLRHTGIRALDLAEAVGVSGPTMTRIERSEAIPSQEVLDRICTVLGLDHAEMQSRRLCERAAISAKERGVVVHLPVESLDRVRRLKRDGETIASYIVRVVNDSVAF